MKLAVTVDGETHTVELDLDRGLLRWKGRDVPVKLGPDAFAKSELEIAGEKFVVEGWPPGNPDPPGPVVVNGERFVAAIVRSSGTTPSVSAPVPNASTAAPAASPAPPSGGTVVLPPMPGRVVEIRVHEGDTVAKGQVLLVLEAMKMRNEVVAPVAGRVTSLPVPVGANVRAREPLVVLAPTT
ncbi:MAG TPA: biotin/lipoyl-containing protein [Thermoplasmata archaeon]|jgi:biotin carboxyl carrier protein|nr:biotin/lipoyl-containing protein [Thermoplasmata archaeon]